MVFVFDGVGLHLVVNCLVIERFFVEAHLLWDLLAVKYLRLAGSTTHHKFALHGRTIESC